MEFEKFLVFWSSVWEATKALLIKDASIILSVGDALVVIMITGISASFILAFGYRLGKADAYLERMTSSVKRLTEKETVRKKEKNYAFSFPFRDGSISDWEKATESKL